MSVLNRTWEPAVLADTPLGHELREFARRLLGPGPAAAEAVMAALARPVADRIEAIARTAAECRGRDGESVALTLGARRSLSAAVTAELERATAALPARQREVLALRDLLRLSYEQTGAVLGLEQAAVAALLARARLHLHEELRGRRPDPGPPCPAREQSLRLLVRRQDSEPLSVAEDNWILDHLGVCPACARAHAQLLEAGVRYRAWARR